MEVAEVVGSVALEEAAEVEEVVEACDVGGVDTIDGVAERDREGGNRSFRPVFCCVDRPLLFSDSDKLAEEELLLRVSLSLILSFSGETSRSGSSDSPSDSVSVSSSCSAFCLPLSVLGVEGYLTFSRAFSRFRSFFSRSRSFSAFLRSVAGLYSSATGEGGTSAWDAERSLTLGIPTCGPLRLRIDEKCSQSW